MSIIGKPVIRIDGADKVTGKIKYMGDLMSDDMLYAKLLFPPVPRGKVKKIDYSEVLKVPGVVDVVKSDDIPGTNGYGLIFKDQKVFYKDEFNYEGDPLAAIVAVSEHAAAEGLKKVILEVEELPPLRDFDSAMAPDAPVIHEGGNQGAHYHVVNGDAEAAFAQADIVLEHTFKTGYQEHGYLEPENGMARPLENGGVEVFCACQNNHRSVRDLETILGMDASKIIVHSTPIGGGFGGKDDLLLQGILAVCALKCQKPVHISLTREESFKMGPKRMPMEIKVKMGASKDGTFLANQVSVKGTFGAHASYAPAVLDFSLEHACGTYYFPNIDIEGTGAYVNGPLVGAFRGFGNNQMNYAVESMVDLMARALEMDPIELRLKNLVKQGDTYSYGHISFRSNASEEILLKMQESPLLKHRHQIMDENRPWIRRGVGVSFGMQGMGLGNHVHPDGSECRLELTEDGELIVYCSNEEMGQGSLTTLQMIAAEAMHMPMSAVHMFTGISNLTPDSGPITASRTTYISGKAIVGCAEQLIARMCQVLHTDALDYDASMHTVQGYAMSEVVSMLKPEDRVASFHVDFQDEVTQREIGLHAFYSHVGEIVTVEIDTLTGAVKVLEAEMYTSAGKVINPLGLEGQCEGGMVMSEGYALLEDFRSQTRNYQTYMMPVMSDIPKITVTAIEQPEEDGPFGAKGVGEVVSVPGTAAIVNALQDASGVRYFDIPVTPEKLLMGLH